MNLFKNLIISFIATFAALFSDTRELTISPTLTSPVIDGVINDSAWEKINPTSHFIQSSPNPGKPMTEKTEVRVTYSEDSLYVFAMLYDSSPDSIMTQMTGREGIGNSEYFSLTIDTFKDKMNGYRFGVSSANSRSEGRISNERYNGQWNAIWNSQVTFNDSGWALELSIPFSILRFSNENKQGWRINFNRTIRRKNESGSWNEVKPTIAGSMTQMGELFGIRGVKSHSQLVLTPYLSSAVQFGESFRAGSAQAYRGGIDLHFTPNKTTILDMILLPDYGQVTSDNKVLNLSYSEIVYGEQRPFFSEGMNLFNKGGLFLSRRIGGKPSKIESIYNEINDTDSIVSNPAESALLNATKYVKHLNDNASYGIFNASTEKTYAIIEDSNHVQRSVLTEPFVNYNVFVYDKIIRNNSTVTYTNTNVYRANVSFNNASVNGITFQLKNPSNTYAIAGNSKYSSVSQDDSIGTGYQYKIQALKTSGKTRFTLSHYAESDTYNPNDLGYLHANNEFSYHGRVSYSLYDPIGPFLRSSISASAKYRQLFKPRTYTDSRLSFNSSATFTNYISSSFGVTFQPGNAYDYLEPRRKLFDKKLLLPSYYQMHGHISTDGRKKIGMSGGIYWIDRKGFSETGLSLWSSIWYRFNDQSSMSYSISTNNEFNDHGWVTEVNDSTIFGARNIEKIENNFSLGHRFSKDLSMGMRVRHYWTQGHYVDFFNLENNGELSSIPWGINNDFNYNTFNIDFNLSWQFLPLSQLSLSIKDSFSNYTSDITGNYVSNFNDIIQQPRSKQISLKMIYYFDSSPYLLR
ncbi:MAG: carbohydrate binding family 9 domain-containing protein [Candidatus Marinimicrobia bacterium]|nr:carbohydrate binding family 9 domain-containing protein [Candidatus Neomarinimicrobiota bacterium]MBT7278953.1 carbohydrate binding family 9 domain-containing protein [Candidatus Neomarinimicrobiota bacterium]